jgi:hypothetical protein
MQNGGGKESLVTTKSPEYNLIIKNGISDACSLRY